MVLAIALALGLVAWSLVADLVVGDVLYTVRNLTLAGLLLVVGRRAGIGWSSLGLGRSQVGSGWRWGWRTALIVAAVVAVAVMLADVVAPVGSLLADRRADLPPDQLAFHALVRIPLGTAVFEEIAFRGLLLAVLLRITTPVWAVTWSSVAFGLWHVAPTITNLRINELDPASGTGVLLIIGAVVVTALAGALFCALRLVSGSLLAPVLAHWATNSFGLLGAAITQRGPG